MCRHRHLLKDRTSSRNTIITSIQKKEPKSDIQIINRFNNISIIKDKTEEDGSFDD